MEKVKILLALLFTIFTPVFTVLAQGDIRNVACSCQGIERKFSNEPMAFGNISEWCDRWVNQEFLPIYREEASKGYLPYFPYDRVNVIAVNCISQYGAIYKNCKMEEIKLGGSPHLIMYDMNFMESLKESSFINAIFILTHEMGHMFANNLHLTIPIDHIAEEYEKKTGKKFNKENLPSKEDLKAYSDKYKEEITADLYGIWMLKKYFEKHFMKDAWIRSNFREENLKKIFSDIKKVAPHMCSAGTSHPNCDFRGHLIDKFLEISFWKKVEGRKNTFKGFAEELFNNTIAEVKETGNMSTIEETENTKILIWLRKQQKGDSLRVEGDKLLTKEHFWDALGKYQDALVEYEELANSPNVKEIVTKIEKIQKVLRVKSFSQLQLIVGNSFYSPQLESKGMRILSTKSNSITLGLKVGRYSFENRFGGSLDIKYTTPLQFDSFEVEGAALERFQMPSLVINPRLLYRAYTFHNRNKLSGVFISLGGTLNQPFKFSYQNSQLPNSDLNVSYLSQIGYTIGVSLESFKRYHSRIGDQWHLGVVGGYQPLKFDSPMLMSSNYKAQLLYIGLEGGFSLFPAFAKKK